MNDVGQIDTHQATTVGKAVVQVSIAMSQQELDALKEEWTDLIRTSPSATPPLRWKWISEWWRIYGETYGDGGRGLRILVVRRGERLIGILPLYEGQRSIGGFNIRRLTFISMGAAEFEETCVDYLDMVYAPGEATECVSAIAEALCRCEQLQWHELVLPNMSQTSGLAPLAGTLAARGQRVEAVKGANCYLFDMRDGFEAYLKSRGRKVRYAARKMLRQVDDLGMDFDIANNAREADEFFDQLVELHRKRWMARGKTGSFAPRHEEFHRSLTREGVSSGEVIIARLATKGMPLALIYGHRMGEKFHCYQQGVETSTEHGLHSPGTAAWLMLMRHMAERGVTVFDFLKGSNNFKMEYSTGLHPLMEMRVTKVNFRTLSFAAASFSQRAARKILRLVSGKWNGPPAGISAGPGKAAITEADSKSEPAEGDALQSSELS